VSRTSNGSPGAVTLPLRGRSGPYRLVDLLAALHAWGASGTLAVREGRRVVLTRLIEGEAIGETALGEAPSEAESVAGGGLDKPDAQDLPFVFHPHGLDTHGLDTHGLDPRDLDATDPDSTGTAPEANVDPSDHEVPGLPSLLPDATWPALLVLPALPGGSEVPAGSLSLPALVAHLDARGVRGAVSVVGDGETVAALIAGGRIVAAAGDKHGRELQRSDAMRLLSRFVADPKAAPLQITPLPEVVLAAVAGVMLNHKRSAPHGVRIGERSATILEAGQPLLRVAYQGAERLGRFAAEPAVDRLPALPLPDDPPDWETRTYHLTLRGRDALDPMTELSMRFDEDYGAAGKAILRALRRGLDVETTSAELGMDLDALGGWLRRLESEGMVRAS